MTDTNQNKNDTYWQHEFVIRKLNDFKGGTFEFKYLENPEGICVKVGNLKDDLSGFKEPQKYFFNYEQFTMEQAKEYLEENGIEFIKSKKAEKKVEDKQDPEIEKNVEEMENVDDTNPNDKPKHKKAKNAVNRAVANGTIKKANKCSKCGSTSKIEAHHNKGYDKKNTFSITWLCQACHRKLHSKNKTEDDIIDSYHLDTFDETKLLLTSDIEKTPEGYLKTRAIVTNTGIFNYLMKDGTILRELRDNDEVFNEESLNSLKNIPLTDGHPPETITSENAKKYQVGFTGSDVRQNGHAVSIDLTFTDKNMIEKIESGEKRALSCGYEAKLDYSVAGQYYFGNNMVDAMQKHIRYNHVAAVENGRAGDLAKIPINIDSVDNIYTQILNPKEDVNMAENTNNVAVMVDGINYTVEKDVAKHIHNLDTSIKTHENTIDELNKKVTELTAKKDAAENEIKNLKEENEKAKLTDEQIQNKVNQRIELLKIADSVEIECKDTDSNKDVKIAIIKSKNENFDASEKSDEYIDAYFDSIKESVKTDIENKPSNENKKKVFGDNLNTKTPSITNNSKQKMYDEYKKKVINQSNEYKGAMHV